MTRPLSERLFHQGEVAARAVGLGSGLYYCPICGEGFDREALKSKKLTKEHVPPRSVGGTAIILTCKECNNFAGHKYEKDLKNRSFVINQARGLSRNNHEDLGFIKLEAGGTELNANLVKEGTKIRFQISEKNNHRSVEAFQKSMLGASEGYQLQIRSGKAYSKNNVKLSDLKAAYLVMVARFGYTLGFDQRMRTIRKTLKQGSDASNLVAYLDSNQSLDGQIIVAEKQGVFALHVQDRFVVVPWPSRPINDFPASGETLQLNGNLFQFPTGFHADLDHYNGKARDLGNA